MDARAQRDGTDDARSTRRIGRLLLAPATGALAVWMLVPLAMTLWFSFQRYNLLNPQSRGPAGWSNYAALLGEATLWTALLNTIALVGGVLVLSVIGGLVVAAIFDEPFPGRRAARLLVIAPFFVMPTVSALVWKNLLLHPVNGLLAAALHGFGLPAIDAFTDWPMSSIVLIVAWQWTPFAALIFMTSMQSIDPSIGEAAALDGAGWHTRFFHLVLPHLGRAIGVVVMIESIFLLSTFAEILVTTSGGPGLATTNLAYLIYLKALLQYDVGYASAGGVIAILLANAVAVFFMRTVSRSLAA
ncbi:MAG: sugar ABC transporter permease [Rhodothermales bacterium]